MSFSQKPLLKPHTRSIPGARAVLLLAAIALILLPEAGYADRGRRLSVLTQAETLEELLRLVQRNYLVSVDQADLYHGAIRGYLSGLDPHSTYIAPDELKDAQERLSGSFEGIGIYFEVIADYLTVVSPIEGSPAYEAGLLAGDRIVEIDGRSAIGIKTKEVARRLKGPEGTRVKLQVHRAGEDEFLPFEIVRDKVEVPSVRYAFKVSPDVGYVRLSKFSTRTATDLLAAIQELLDAGAEKLILDLRGNGGGYLEQAVAVADLLIEKGELLVYTQGRHSKSREDHFSANDPIIPRDMPLVVMVNSFSASASEIVAGALQDYDRGLVVGRTTFGKGLVQKQYPLKNGGAVLLTVAKYFTPSERPIQRPFTDDREAYRSEAHDGYDPNLDPDSLASKPVYFTRILKRKVYGNGGISPDVQLDPDTLSKFERRLEPGHFFEFADGIARSATGPFGSVEEYVDGYEPGRRALAQFREFLKKKQVVFSERDFKLASAYIGWMIKQRVAQIRWGMSAGGRVLAAYDPEMEQALGLLNRAESLLASRTRRVDRERTYLPSSGSSGHGQVR